MDFTSLSHLPGPNAKRLALRISPAAERALRLGHPWVFDQAITGQNLAGRPGDLAVIFDDQRRLMSSLAPPLKGHRPSITVTFKAIAQQYGSGAVGIILTGMGNDGAEGLLDICNAHGTTVAQDESSCIIFGMPKEAIALGAVKHILPLREIPEFLSKICTQK